MPDPYCILVNPFNFSWKTRKIHAFPLFSFVGAVYWNSSEATPLRSWLYHSGQHCTGFQQCSPVLQITPSVPCRFENAFPIIQTVKSSTTVFEVATVHSFHGSAFQEKLKKSSSQLGNLKLQTKYKSFIDRCKRFCIWGSENCYTPSVNSVLNFL